MMQATNHGVVGNVGNVQAAQPIITTEIIQKHLDENQQLILAILENQNLGKLNEVAAYQARLQHNLMYLAAIADAQPATASPAANAPAQASGAAPRAPVPHMPHTAVPQAVPAPAAAPTAQPGTVQMVAAAAPVAAPVMPAAQPVATNASAPTAGATPVSGPIVGAAVGTNPAVSAANSAGLSPVAQHLQPQQTQSIPAAVPAAPHPHVIAAVPQQNLSANQPAATMAPTQTPTATQQ